MPGVPKELIEHSLNVDPKATPKKQRLRRFAQDKREVIKKELAKLLSAGFIKEVFHPKWLANPVLVNTPPHALPLGQPPITMTTLRAGLARALLGTRTSAQTVVACNMAAARQCRGAWHRL
ncbi:unnamed protein product [Urochloa humidicola]